MKTAYYLAHQTVLERFDALFAELDILATTVAIEKVPSLTAFIMAGLSFITREHLFDQEGFEELDINSWDDVEIIHHGTLRAEDPGCASGLPKHAAIRPLVRSRWTVPEL